MRQSNLADLEPEGFWDLEFSAEGAFRWTRERFSLRVPQDGNARFATLEFANNVAGNVLRAGPGDDAVPLVVGWQQVDLALEAADALELSIERPFHPPGDGRALGLMLRSVLFHGDEEWHRLINGRRENSILNETEFVAGSETLASVPPMLRITLSKQCNIANRAACVYCDWDYSKRVEQGSPDMTPELFARLGRYGELAASITDCSIGEPPMEASFAAQIEVVTRGGRQFEFTSNGQTLGPKKRRALLGKTARVYVSIDSATADGYARYRDHRFNAIVANLRALIAEREAHGRKPEVYVSFLVMRSNRDEIEAYLRLMQDIGVDAVKFRALYIDDAVFTFDTTRAGHRFVYDEERLSVAELAEARREIERHRHLFAGEIIVEWEAFDGIQAEAAEGGHPICSEPWKTGYVLSRGIMPCCFARKPLGTWDEIDAGDVEGSLHRIYNNAGFRELRRELAAGRLADYCLGTESCPLTKLHKAKVAAAAQAIDAPVAA